MSRSQPQAESEQLARDAQLMEMELRKMREEMARRRVVNPEGFSKKGEIWGAYRNRKQRARARPKRAGRGRQTVSANSRRRGRSSRPRPRPVQPRRFDGVPAHETLPTDIYSHHFSTVFDKTEVETGDATEDMANAAPSSKSKSSVATRSSPARRRSQEPRTRPRPGRRRQRGGGRSRGGRSRRATAGASAAASGTAGASAAASGTAAGGRRRPRGVRRKGGRRKVPSSAGGLGLGSTTGGSRGLTSLDRERFRDNLMGTFETSDLVPASYTMNTLEGVMRKRKVSRAQQGPSSLLLEVFDEWRRMEIAGSGTVDEMKVGIAAAKQASASFVVGGVGADDMGDGDMGAFPPTAAMRKSVSAGAAAEQRLTFEEEEELSFLAPSAPSASTAVEFDDRVSSTSSGGVGTTSSIGSGVGTDPPSPPAPEDPFDRRRSFPTADGEGDADPPVGVVSGGVGTETAAGEDQQGGGGGMGSLLDGSYDEDAAHQGFQEALMEWRREQGLVKEAIGRSSSDRETGPGTGTGTGTGTAGAGVGTSTAGETAGSRASVGVTSESSGSLLDGEFDEEKQHRLFTEAVMQWRKDQEHAQQDSHVDRLDLFAGDFTLPGSTNSTESARNAPVETAAGGESAGGMEVFLENVKNCVVVSYFDEIEKQLERRLESQRI